MPRTFTFQAGDFISDFKVLAQIGGGGFAEVYKVSVPAHLPTPDREAALKLALDTTSPDHFRMLLEAHAQSDLPLQHENILRSLHTGDHKGRPWILLPLCRGGSLEEKLRQGVDYSDPQLLLTLVEQLASALTLLHGARVYHRDIHGGNILFDQGCPKLADFGAVKHQDVPATRMTLFRPLNGTSWAPEEHDDGELDWARVDLYQFAWLVWRCLHGVDPFTLAASGGATVRVGPGVDRKAGRQARKGKARRNPALKSPATAAMSEVLVKALAFKAKERHRSVDEFFADFKLAATNPSEWRRRRRLRGNGLFLFACLSVLAGVLIHGPLAGFMTWPAEPISVPGFTYLRHQRFGKEGPRVAVYRCDTYAEAIGGLIGRRDVDTEFVLMPPGAFDFGSSRNELGATTDEAKKQVVTQESSFLIARSETSVRVWNALQALSLPLEGAPLDPAAGISYANASRFTAALRLRLPSEEEWEYACDGHAPTARVGMVTGRASPASVAAGRPNRWGLLHALGNCWEWVRSSTPRSVGTEITKGGAHNSSATDWRPGRRLRLLEVIVRPELGFRAAASVALPD